MKGGDGAILKPLCDGRIIWPLGLLAVGLGLGVTLSLVQWFAPGLGWPIPLALASLALALVSLAVFLARLRRQLLGPLVALESALTRVCQGEPGASRSLRDLGLLGPIAQGVASLNEELTDLYEDMDNRVARQTQRLAQKTASLKILYDVAAGINQTDGLEDLLLRFLRVLKEMVNARAATIRLIMPDGTRRLVGSIGLDDGLVRAEDMTPVDLCLCGAVLSPGDILCRNDARFCSKVYGRRMFGSDEVEPVSVPLRYQDELLGVYALFVDRPGLAGREDIVELLATVGHHLGVAVAKHRSDEEARRLSILDERNALAHELHDSLAQTLASLRFQVRMLADSLAGMAIPEAAHHDLERVRSGVDEAHTELREMLATYRAPLDRQGLAPALEKLTARLAQESPMHVLFQNDCHPFDLPAAAELQILRIAQEALANVRKHAQAHTVRVLLARHGGDAHVLLVEDDGVGFSAPRHSAPPGEHIGLSIMEERARRIGAELHLESEPGEGTRVELVFSPERRKPGAVSSLAAPASRNASPSLDVASRNASPSLDVAFRDAGPALGGACAPSIPPGLGGRAAAEARVAT
jgi:two-component system nitrate/nitrite sensor histidine kinase NarX